MPTSKPAPRALLAAAPLSASVRALAERGELRNYRKNTLLITEGEVGDTIYVIVAGRLRAFSSNEGETREIVYGTYGPGEYVGEMGLDGLPRSASVLAVEATVCSVIMRPTLEAHLAENPSFAIELLAKVIRRARAATLSAKQMALNDVWGRLKPLLESLAAERADGTWRIEQKLTHAEIGARVGCTREMVTRVLLDMRRGGHICLNADKQLEWTKLPARW